MTDLATEMARALPADIDVFDWNEAAKHLMGAGYTFAQCVEHMPDIRRVIVREQDSDRGAAVWLPTFIVLLLATGIASDADAATAEEIARSGGMLAFGLIAICLGLLAIVRSFRERRSQFAEDQIDNAEWRARRGGV